MGTDVWREFYGGVLPGSELESDGLPEEPDFTALLGRDYDILNR